MKLTTILMIATFLQVSAASYAQRVTYTNKQASLEQIFKEIRQQTGYNVLWSTNNIKDIPAQDVNFKDTPLQEVLEKVLDGQPLTYVIEDKSVLIKPKEPPLLDNLKDKTVKLLNLPADITGLVTDSLGNPVIGASVSLKGTSYGGLTDNNGRFTLSKIPQGKYTLVITYIGYGKFERTIEAEGQDINLHIILHTATSALDQVEVIAYGQTSRRFDVGSVATVTAKQIEVQPNENLLLSLEGQVPGLTVTPTSGAPGAAVQVQIRGQNSLSNGSNGYPFDQPLFIIDGVPFAPQNNNTNQLSNLSDSRAGGNQLGGAYNIYAGSSPFNSINPLDIESITVLKDADAT